MNARTLSLLLLLAGPLAAQSPSGTIPAPAPTPGSAPAPGAPPQELLPNQQAFLNLPEAQRNEFIKYLSEAVRLFGQKRVFETMEQLDKAEAIFKESSEVYNVRGNCYVEIRAFDKALAQYDKALELAKDNSSIEFNIGEVHFVTKEWRKALDVFQSVLKKVPASNTALSRLVEFKIMLCQKKLGLDKEAEALAAKYDYLDDSPFHYYANAALAYSKKDLLKAEEWLAVANRVFRDPAILAPWQDTLVEYGYIKSFYGSEDSGE